MRGHLEYRFIELMHATAYIRDKVSRLEYKVPYECRCGYGFFIFRACLPWTLKITNFLNVDEKLTIIFRNIGVG